MGDGRINVVVHLVNVVRGKGRRQQRLHIVAPTFGAKSVLYLSISTVVFLSIYVQHSVVDRCWGLKHCASNRRGLLLLEISLRGEGSERGDMLYYLRSILLFCSTFQKEKEEGGA